MNRFLATVQWLAADAAGTTYTVNLPAGFNLKLVQVEWCGLQSASDAASEAVTERRGIGWCSGTSARRCIGTRSTDASASSDCGSVARDDAVCATHSGAGTTDGLLDITTFGASDQLIFTVDDQVPANITVFVKCWGGTEVSGGVGDFAEPAATGAQTYTATGFVSGGTDQAVFAAFCQATAAINTSTPNVDSGLSIGYGDGTTSVFVMGNSDEASGTMDTDGAGQSGAILGMCTAGGSSTLNSLANLTGFGTDQFTLNWSATANTARKGIYAYLKGCAVKVGEYTIAGNSASATATVSGLSFAPKLAVFIGRMATESAGTAGNNDRMSVGGATSATDRHAWGILDEDATASSNSEINTVLEYDSMLAFPSTAGALLASYDINAWNSNGWQEIVDNAGGVASEWRGYIAFGDASGPVTVSITGASSAGAAGTIAISGKANVPLTGAEAAGAAGSLTVGLNTPVSIAGAQSAGLLGDLATSGKANVPLAGAESVGAPGNLTILAAATVQLLGNTATGAAGTITVDAGGGAVIALLTGVAAVGAAGDVAVSGQATVPLPGAESAGAAGSIAVSGRATVPLSGAEAAGAAGAPSVSAAVMAAIAGVSANGQVGSLTVIASVLVTLPAVFATGEVGLLQISGKANVPLTGAEAQALAGVLVAYGPLLASGERTIVVDLEGRQVIVDVDARVVSVAAQGQVIVDDQTRIVRVAAPSRTIQ